jgi:two-component system KDP operon response regulator KdpE
MTKPATILVIDDEPELLRVLGLILRDAGYQVHQAASGREGILQAQRARPDIVILDLMLPDIPGSEVAAKIRETSEVPVLMLSANESPVEKVRALDAGADDFITKPFDPDELLARVRVALRRKSSQREGDVTVIGDLRIDRTDRKVTVGDEDVGLTKTEFLLLDLFARHHGKLLSHERILKEIWGAEADSRREYLRVYVSSLRKKLATPGLRCPQIENRSSIGYRLT